MYIWYTAPYAKINYLDFTMFHNDWVEIVDFSMDCTMSMHIEAWLESFSQGNRVPECTFLSQIESIVGRAKCFFIKKILFVTVHCIFQTWTMRILRAIFETKMYIWYTAPSTKINYLGFTMSMRLWLFTPRSETRMIWSGQRISVKHGCTLY